MSSENTDASVTSVRLFFSLEKKRKISLLFFVEKIKGRKKHNGVVLMLIYKLKKKTTPNNVS